MNFVLYFRFKGMRLQRVYDIDHKTYLFKFQLNSEKCVLLLESGVRLHVTNYEWTKNDAPSSFSMKVITTYYVYLLISQDIKYLKLILLIDYAISSF